jgi:GntR family transcriptional regulator of gluconate operon
MIVRGVLAPGSPVIERPFAARLGVSRGSLRSALRRLEHEGFVRPSAAGVYSRAVVTPLTVADMDEIYTLLAVLNGAAARQAAAMQPSARKAIGTKMEALNATLAAALAASTDDVSTVYEIDHQIHMVYVAAASGPRLRALYAAVSSQGERYGRAYNTAIAHAPAVGGLAKSSPGEHRAIIDAIRAGHQDEAEQAAIVNWRNAAARLRRVITSAGERGSFWPA